MNNKFYRVATKDYYKEYETIGPYDELKSGTKILVRWPDKSETEETLLVHNGSGFAQIDMNNYPDTFLTRNYNVETVVYGKKVLVPLRGMMVAVLEKS